MTARVQDVGGNLTLVIPPHLASQANVSSGSEVDLRVTAGEIIVRATGQPRKPLQEMLAIVTEQNPRGDRLLETRHGSRVFLRAI